MFISQQTRSEAKVIGSGLAPEIVRVATSAAATAVEEETGFPVSVLLEAGFSLEEIIKAKKKNKVIPNPYFISHGFADAPSPNTVHYLNVRKAKRIGSAIYSVAGKGVQIALEGTTAAGFDTLGMAKHGLAGASTGAHLIRLGLLARRVRQSAYLVGLIEDMIKIKTGKAGVRGAHLAAACIPEAIASTVVDGVTSLAAAGLQIAFKDIINRVSCEVHWRAYQELAIGRIAGGGFGPACMMMQELMNHIHSVGNGVFTPTGTVKKLIHEPAGFLVIKDKLSMM